MRNNIRGHLLRPRDALHLAAMQKVGCLHLVSQDSDFDHIPAITLTPLGNTSARGTYTNFTSISRTTHYAPRITSPIAASFSSLK